MLNFFILFDNVTKVEPVSNLFYCDNCFCDIGLKYKNNFMEVINNYGNFK